MLSVNLKLIRGFIKFRSMITYLLRFLVLQIVLRVKYFIT